MASLHRPPIQVTVATLVADGDRLLYVEEEHEGRHVLNQPAGHVEADESLLRAAERETYEETGYRVRCQSLLGVHLMAWPRHSTLRFAFVAEVLEHDPTASLDVGIVAVHWLTDDELNAHALAHRTPLVAACVRDFRAGRRYPLELLRWWPR
jgi:8-oxo-dGTP pyrophosphatase MutT (NUDIX family)